MIRRRHFTPAMRARLRELDEKPGLGERALQQQSVRAMNRLSIIDAQPEEWRALLNDYPHSVVAEAAEAYATPQAVRRALERRLGKAI